MRTTVDCPEPPERRPAARVLCWPLTVAAPTHAEFIARRRTLMRRWLSK